MFCKVLCSLLLALPVGAALVVAMAVLVSTHDGAVDTTIVRAITTERVPILFKRDGRG